MYDPQLLKAGMRAKSVLAYASHLCPLFGSSRRLMASLVSVTSHAARNNDGKWNDESVCSVSRLQCLESCQQIAVFGIFNVKIKDTVRMSGVG